MREGRTGVRERESEFNQCQPEHSPLPPEFQAPLPESVRAREFNDQPGEFSARPEEDQRGYAGKKRQTAKKRDRHIGKAAFQMAAMAISAVAVVTAASALSGGTFLPELGAFAANAVKYLDQPLVSGQPGMDLAAAAEAWAGSGGGTGGSGGGSQSGGQAGQTPPSPAGPASPESGENQQGAQTPENGGQGGSSQGGAEQSGQSGESQAGGSTRPGGSRPGQGGTPGGEAGQEGPGQGGGQDQPGGNTQPGGGEQPNRPDQGGNQNQPGQGGADQPAGPEESQEPAAPDEPVPEPEPDEDDDNSGGHGGSSGGSDDEDHGGSSGGGGGGGGSSDDDDSHTHAWREASRTEPTCTQAGSVTYTCSCGETRVETIAPAGHDWGDWKVTQEAHCDTPGSREHVCSVCGRTGVEIITAPGHAWDAWETVKEPTCAPGLERRVCDVCGEEETRDIPATAAHTWGGWTAGADSHSRTCSACGETESGSHSVTEWLHMGEANHQGICSVCQGSVTNTAAAEWTYTYVDGNTHTKTCSLCGYEDMSDTAHTPGYVDNGDGTHTQTACTLCQPDGSGQPEACTYGAWQPDTGAGTHTHTCTLCGGTETESHTWSVDNDALTAKCDICGAEISLSPDFLFGFVHQQQSNWVLMLVITPTNSYQVPLRVEMAASPGTITLSDGTGTVKAEWSWAYRTNTATQIGGQLEPVFGADTPGNVSTRPTDTWSGGFTIEVYDKDNNVLLFTIERDFVMAPPSQDIDYDCVTLTAPGT